MKRGVISLNQLEFNLLKTAALTLPQLQSKISTVDISKEVINIEINENEVETLLDALPVSNDQIPATATLRHKLIQILS